MANFLEFGLKVGAKIALLESVESIVNLLIILLT